MKRFLFATVAALSLSLSGCVSLGASQQQSETAYLFGAIAADVYVNSGKATQDAVGTICTVDNANYKVLTATRNIADGVDYHPADNAHAALQFDGGKLNSLKCGMAPPGG